MSPRVVAAGGAAERKVSMRDETVFRVMNS